MSKFGNVTGVSPDGHAFDSKAEAARYEDLRLMEYAGQISDLRLQPEFVLQEGFRDRHGAAHRAIKYRADFMYSETGKTVVEDVKGHKTQVYQIKKKLFLKRYPDLYFREYEAKT